MIRSGTFQSEEVIINSPLPDARSLLQLAGLQLPPVREAVVAAGLQASTAPIAEALARGDYGETEPAFRFRPPPSSLV